MKLYALTPFLLAPLAASVAIPEVNNGVVNANADADAATGAVEDFATYTDVTTLEVNADAVATLTCKTNYDCGFGALCINGECVVDFSPPELATRDEETNLDTKGEPRRCNNINKWCPPHQICYRGLCVTPGALATRADDGAVHEETRCRMNMDCPPGQSCVRGECRRRRPPVT